MREEDWNRSPLLAVEESCLSIRLNCSDATFCACTCPFLYYLIILLNLILMHSSSYLFIRIVIYSFELKNYHTFKFPYIQIPIHSNSHTFKFKSHKSTQSISIHLTNQPSITTHYTYTPNSSSYKPLKTSLLPCSPCSLPPPILSQSRLGTSRVTPYRHPLTCSPRWKTLLGCLSLIYFHTFCPRPVF